MRRVFDLVKSITARIPIYVDRWLDKFPKYYKSGKKTCSTELPSYVARWANTIPIDIENKIRHEFVHFPRLDFLFLDA